MSDRVVRWLDAALREWVENELFPWALARFERWVATGGPLRWYRSLPDGSRANLRLLADRLSANGPED